MIVKHNELGDLSVVSANVCLYIYLHFQFFTYLLFLLYYLNYFINIDVQLQLASYGRAITLMTSWVDTDSDTLSVFIFLFDLRFKLVLDQRFIWTLNSFLAPMETGKNALSGNYKICNFTTIVSLHYLRKFKNTQQHILKPTVSVF